MSNKSLSESETEIISEPKSEKPSSERSFTSSDLIGDISENSGKNFKQFSEEKDKKTIQAMEKIEDFLKRKHINSHPDGLGSVECLLHATNHIRKGCHYLIASHLILKKNSVTKYTKDKKEKIIFFKIGRNQHNLIKYHTKQLMKEYFDVITFFYNSNSLYKDLANEHLTEILKKQEDEKDS